MLPEVTPCAMQIDWSLGSDAIPSFQDSCKVDELSEGLDTSSLGWLLVDTARILRTVIGRRLNQFGLTRTQWHALCKLCADNPRPQMMLANRIGVRSATVTKLIDRLELAGWVKRCADPLDRRIKLITMTEKSKSIMAEINLTVHDILNKVTADLSSEDIQVISDDLSLIKSRLIYLVERD